MSDRRGSVERLMHRYGIAQDAQTMILVAFEAERDQLRADLEAARKEVERLTKALVLSTNNHSARCDERDCMGGTWEEGCSFTTTGPAASGSGALLSPAPAASTPPSPGLGVSDGPDVLAVSHLQRSSA